MAVSPNVMPVKVLDPLGMVGGSPQEIPIQKYMSLSTELGGHILNSVADPGKMKGVWQSIEHEVRVVKPAHSAKNCWVMPMHFRCNKLDLYPIFCKGKSHLIIRLA